MSKYGFLHFKQLRRKHRSLRGTLTSRIKEALFSVFGENLLPSINTSATPKEIYNWKKSELVNSCYNKIFSTIDPIGNPKVTYMSRILEKVWPSAKCTPNIHIAYAIGVCTTLLNPHNDNIQISQSNLKSQTKKYLVSFASLCRIKYLI